MSEHVQTAHVRKMKTILGPTLSIAIFALLLSGCAPAMENDNDEGTTVSSSSAAMMDNSMHSTGTMMDGSSTGGTMMQRSYKDGTFSAPGSYNSPAGPETIEVSLTIKGGTISAATYKGDATNPRSKEYQDKFAAGFQGAVIGKSIDSLSLTVVNGSSLTPMGFMKALETIKAEAKA